MTRMAKPIVRGGALPDGGGATTRLLLLLLVLCLILPVGAIDRCTIVDCGKDCSRDSLTYKPQRCDECCDLSNIGSGNHRKDAVITEDRLKELEEAVEELRQVVMGMVVVVVLLVLVGLVRLVLHFTKSLPKLSFPFSNKNKESNVQEMTPHKPCNGIDSNSTVVRIAKYQNNNSPVTKRASVSRSAKFPTEDTVGAQEFQIPPYRVRQPSESTCPDESSNMPPHAYDNLALSTSTLHNTSNSSTDTLEAAVSTNTLETTLPSGNNLHSMRDGEMTQV